MLTARYSDRLLSDNQVKNSFVSAKSPDDMPNERQQWAYYSRRRIDRGERILDMSIRRW